MWRMRRGGSWVICAGFFCAARTAAGCQVHAVQERQLGGRRMCDAGIRVVGPLRAPKFVHVRPRGR